MSWLDDETRGAVMFAKLMEALMFHGPASYADLMEHTGLSYHTVMRYTKALRHTERKVIRIQDWGLDSRDKRSIPLFAFNPEQRKDVERPRMSKAEKNAKAAKARRDKRMQMCNSVFNQVLPRYREGARS